MFKVGDQVRHRLDSDYKHHEMYGFGIGANATVIEVIDDGWVIVRPFHTDNKVSTKPKYLDLLPYASIISESTRLQTADDITRNLLSAQSPNTALRYDDNKPRVDLLDPIALEGTAAVLAFGAKKYADHNWQKGMKWSKVYGSLLRHIFKFMKGEDLDQESGLPHVDHIMCNAMFLANYYRQHTDKDDRFKQPTNNLERKVD